MTAIQCLPRFSIKFQFIVFGFINNAKRKIINVVQQLMTVEDELPTTYTRNCILYKTAAGTGDHR